MVQLPDFDGFREEFEDAVEEKVRDYGELGYTINGKYSVFVRGKPDKYNVRLRDGSLVQALHKGRVPPSPDLPVEIDYDQYNRPFIVAPDNAQIPSFSSDQGVNSYQEVGFHTHHRGSGMEYPIDWRLFYQFSPQINDSYSITIQPGFFVYNQQMNYFSGETIDLFPMLPANNGFSKWVIFYLNPTVSPAVISYTEGDSVATLTGLTINSISDIIDLSLNYIPLFAIKLRTPSTRLEDRNIESLLPIASVGGTVSEERGVIVTYEGLPITYNGYVLRYNLNINEAFTLEEV